MGKDVHEPRYSNGPVGPPTHYSFVILLSNSFLLA